MMGSSSSTPWGKASSVIHGNKEGFFSLEGDEPSKSPSRSFKDVLSGNSLVGDTIPNLTQLVFNSVPAVLLFDEEVPKLNPKVLHAPGSIFGLPLQTDQATASRIRPSVARVLVEADISKKHAKEI
ncbi:hypothetical protein MA16_Dca026943 [Dendrobium catenatum]|uniref:Uncharacterized protein n=1 Tax=Dendrobium catenatum TaxID=906689 RepID=A0A2I0V6J4_9ASPA|nr:hypothetical protein MA16_Dca026943 [Dendrobium catenatum]